MKFWNTAKKCKKEVKGKTIFRKETYPVHEEPIEDMAQVMVCELCGEDIFHEEYDSAILLNVQNTYKKIAVT